MGFLVFSRNFVICFFWIFAQLCKMTMPEMWPSPIFKKKFFGQIWAQNGLKFGFFGLFSKFCHLFFLIFCTMMQNDNAQNVTEPDFRKKIFLGKFGPKIGFFGLFSKFCHLLILIFCTMMQNGNAQNVGEPYFWKKIFLGKFGPKMA